jgi:hypothetical protein
MSIKIFVSFFISMLILSSISSKRTIDDNEDNDNDDITTLTFLIEYEPKNDHDHL